jgi:hypothetical protein
LGPLLWKRQPPADAGSIDYVPDYRVRKDDDVPMAKGEADSDIEKDGAPPSPAPAAPARSHLAEEVEKPTYPGPEIEGPWAAPGNLWIIARYRAGPFLYKKFTHGTSGTFTCYLELHISKAYATSLSHSGRPRSARLQRKRGRSYCPHARSREAISERDRAPLLLPPSHDCLHCVFRPRC